MFLSYLCQCLTLQKGHLADLTPPPVFKSFSQFVCMDWPHQPYGMEREAVYQNKGERNTGNSIKGNNNNFLKSKHVNCMRVL